MKDVIIYTKPGCGYCRRAKTLLERKGVPFREIDLSGEPELASDVATRSGQTTVPQVFADGEPLGGCDDIHALDAAGRLDAALGIA